MFSPNNLWRSTPRPGTAHWATVHLLPSLLLSYGVTALLSAALAWLLAHWWNPAQVIMALIVFSLGFYTVIFCCLVSRPQPGPSLLLAAVLTALAGVWLWR